MREMEELCQDPEAELALTYRPGRHEQEWLLSSFGGWFDDGTLEDVLFSVRGGKEANVYAARGGQSVGRMLVAAKVYRPRKHRELRNDAIYREGRSLFDTDGKRVRGRDQRWRRAVNKGTRKGKQVTHISWVSHEFLALQRLYEAGVSVPEPIDYGPNAVLMAFIGDESGAASTLDRRTLSPTEAKPLCDRLLADIETMLSIGVVHGDLSPYNILMWEGALTIIDLPQNCDVFENPNAGWLFVRDVARVCEWFS